MKLKSIVLLILASRTFISRNMKKIRVFFILAFIVNSSTAQNILNNSNLWNVVTELNFGAKNTISYRFSGDTTINGLIYSKLYESEANSPTNWHYYSAWREDGLGKVYQKLRFDYAQQEELVYDFSMEAGDTVVTVFHGTSTQFYCDSIDFAEMLDGTLRKRQFMSDQYGYHEVWVQGIGCLFGLPFSSFQSHIFDYWYTLNCFSTDNELIYKNTHLSDDCYFNTVGIEAQPNMGIKLLSPNPVQGEIRISNPNQSSVFVSLTDARGLMVFSTNDHKSFIEISCKELSSGFYFLRIYSKDKLLYYRKLIKL